MSYRRQNLKHKIDRIKPKWPFFKKWWFWCVVLFFLTGITISYLGLFYSGVQVENIVILGNKKIPTKEIENIVLDSINKNISKSIFLVDKNKLRQNVLNKFSEIERVDVRKRLMQNIDIEVIERTPVAIFCWSAVKTAQECFLIDSGGIIFGKPEAFVDKLPIIWGLAINSQVIPGAKMIKEEAMDLFLKVKDSLKNNFQINLTKMTIAGSDRINIETDEEWKIYFDLGARSDTNSQILKLNLLLGGDFSAGKRSGLRYIDLRPKERAIVCDNQECENN